MGVHPLSFVVGAASVASAVWVVLAVAACAAGHPPARGQERPKSSTGAEARIEQYLDEMLVSSPARARALGLHEYDGKVARIGEAAMESEVARVREHLQALGAIDFEAEQDPVKLDLELMRLHAEQTVFAHDVLGEHRKILAYNDLFDVSGYLVRDYAPLAQRVNSLLDHVEAASLQVGLVLSTLDVRQPRTYLETAKKVLAGMREYYQGDVRKESASVLAADPQLRARFDRVIGDGITAIGRLETWVEQVGMKNAKEEFALGEDKFRMMLRTNEGLDIPLDQLEEMASADYKKNYDAFVATARRIDPKLPVRDVADKISRERIAEGLVLTTAQSQLGQLLAFIQEKEIITIGSEDRATVAVTPPFMRWNSAFLDMAGPFEKAKGTFYYISPPDPSWPKEVQDAYLPYEGDLLATSIHEVYPGHFVQGLHQRLAPTRAQKFLDSYAFTEGWAHYAEQMILDEGFGHDDARLRLGQLSNALLRNCRFIAAIGLHTRGMTVDQATQLFQEKCFVDRGNAIQQAYRGTFDPGYLSYTLGKLQILELRRKFFAAKNTKSLRAFHDWLLSFGSAPLQLIEHRL